MTQPTTADKRPLLVVGASGQLGSRVVQQLVALRRPVRALVRRTSRVEHLRLTGVELVRGDLTDPPSIDAACQGAGAVIATANAVAPLHGSSFASVEDRGYATLFDACRRHGCGRFVLVSVPVTPRDQAVPLFRYKRLLEQRLQASGLLPLATSSADMPPVPMVLDLRVGQARLQLDGSARDVLRLTALDARFALDGPSLAALGDVLGATLPSTAPVSMRGQLRKDGAVWGVGVANLVVGKSRLRGDFRYDTTEAVPRLTGALAGERLSLPDLAPALGAKPPQRAKSKAARGARDRLLPQRDFDVPSLRAMNADVKLSIDSVALGTEELANFAPLQGRVRLQDQVLQIEDLVARNSGGELRGALTLDARSEKQPLWHADVRWSGVQLERFVKTRNPRSKEAPRTAGKAAGTPASKTAKQGAAPGQGGYVSGVLGGAAKLRGSGRSVASMMASLDGSAQAWVSDGRVSHLLVELSGIDLAESLGLLVTGDDTLPVRCAVARFAVKDGVARPEVAVIDTPDTTLLVTGEISLVDERLALDVAARPKDMSLVALRGPVHVRGSFGKPQVELDKARMGLRLAAAAALAVVAAPVAGLLALVDLGESERAVCGDALAQIKGPAPKQLQGEVAAKKK